MRKRHWLNMSLQLGFAGLLGCLGVTVFACKTLAQSTPSNIVPDDTLSAESSQVIRNYQGLPIEIITGGATRGINLFHSFQEFNINNGRGAYFFIPNADTQNILARVTGRNASDILGTLGTFGKSQPNLFLINPNGIVFGENASLNVGGSFVATTANAVKLGETGLFSASEAKNSSLLSVHPSAFFFNTLAAKEIINRSYQETSNFFDPPTGLEVKNGLSLLLVGGDVKLEGGVLKAPNGRIELGGLVAPGTVGLNVNNDILSLNFPDNVQRADVAVTDRGYINVTGQGSGEIIINSHNLNIFNSSIYAGNEIFSDFILKPPSISIQPGNITLNATGEITISTGNIIYTESPDAAQKLGEININSKFLTLESGSLIRAGDLFSASGGNININTTDSVNVVNSLILARTASGQPGNLRINTKKLFVQQGGQITTLTLNASQGGILDINASEQVELIGTGEYIGAVTIFNNTGNEVIIEAPSGIFNRTFSSDSGGNLYLSTPKLIVQDGAVILTDTSSETQAGNLAINTSNLVELSGTSTLGLPSGIFSLTESSGASGNTTINTEKLIVQNGAQIANSINNLASENKIAFAEPIIYYRTVDIAPLTSIFSTGAAEDVINFTNIKLGDAGNVTIQADKVHLSGISSNGRFASGLFTQAPNSASAGDVYINADKLTLEKGAQISASTFGEGQGGNLTVNTLSFTELQGTSANGLPSGLFTQTSGKGSAGDIIINTRNLTVTDGSVVSAGTTTDSQGDGGDLNIHASESVFISGTSKDGLPTGLSASTRGSGASGTVKITTSNLRVQEGAVVSVTTSGSGAGGKLEVNAPNAVELLGMSADKKIPSGLFARSFSTGSAGNLGIITKKLTIQDGAQVTVSSLGSNKAGNLEVTAGYILLDNQAKLVAETLSGNGGNINLTVSDLLLMRRGAQISTSAGTAQQGGDGGNIDINSRFIVAIPQENSDITANAFTGTGGNVQINSQGVFGIEPRQEPSNTTSDITASSEQGIQGVTTINAPDNNAIQNSLNQLSDNPIDANALIANSCIARRNHPQGGTFFITGSGGLPERPGDAPLSSFSTGTMQNVAKEGELTTSRPRWKIGDPIVEPTGVYRLANGQRMLSRECP